MDERPSSEDVAFAIGDLLDDMTDAIARWKSHGELLSQVAMLTVEVKLHDRPADCPHLREREETLSIERTALEAQWGACRRAVRALLPQVARTHQHGVLHRLNWDMESPRWFKMVDEGWSEIRAQLLVLRDAVLLASTEVDAGVRATRVQAESRDPPPPRILLSATTEQVHQFLFEQFQEGRQPTYDDAQAEGWGRTTYSRHLRVLEAHGLIERRGGRIVSVFPRCDARPAPAS